MGGAVLHKGSEDADGVVANAGDSLYNGEMQNRGLLILFTIMLCAALLSACGGGPEHNGNANVAPAANSETANQTANPAKTNVEELGMHIAIPYETDEAVWREDPESKKLAAVIRISSEDADKLTAKAEAVRPPEHAAIPAETWFPAELIAQAEMSGDNTIKGTSFAANEFFMPPYTEGRIIRAENTDYFILDLSAK